jgi:hypothetical protein
LNGAEGDTGIGQRERRAPWGWPAPVPACHIYWSYGGWAIASWQAGSPFLLLSRPKIFHKLRSIEWWLAIGGPAVGLGGLIFRRHWALDDTIHRCCKAMRVDGDCWRPVKRRFDNFARSGTSGRGALPAMGAVAASKPLPPYEGAPRLGQYGDSGGTMRAPFTAILLPGTYPRHHRALPAGGGMLAHATTVLLKGI